MGGWVLHKSLSVALGAQSVLRAAGTSQSLCQSISMLSARRG